MDRTLDVYASTNPAFGSLVLREAAKAYVAVRNTGMDFALTFVCLPIALSRQVSVTLASTNRATGFLNWLARNPQLLVRFPERIRETAQYTREALRFGIRHGVLAFDGGRIHPSAAGLVRMPRWNASDERGRVLRDASRLGGWLGDLGSAETVFASLGVTP